MSNIEESLTGESNKVGFDKKAYQRELMRKKREAEKMAKAALDGLTLPGDVVVEWDKEKYPERAAWEIAVARSERARRYAKMFPNMIQGSDMKFQTIEWQYENEGLPAIKRPGPEMKVNE